ncbi:MAG TPA: TadE/TadG family type IV pilus assembly protein [Candidatus Sulfotelmatobacter sp.]|nr:TadE/TadG family type IV pilus assembly protein [Candidatus Sulfotelmatobacter sp.]
MYWCKLIWSRLARDTRGSEIAEAAAVLPLMFMVLLGIFWFGQAFSIYGTITHAAREGARAAAVPSCSTCAAGTTPNANAWAAIQASMRASHLDPSNASQPSTIPSFVSCGGTTGCDPNYTNVCIQQPVQITDTATGTGVCGVSVSFQYPYQFWLPFSTLNLQKIQLPANAAERIETQ